MYTYLTNVIKITILHSVQLRDQTWCHFKYMCYDLVRSREHWLWDIARKRNKFLVIFYCSENPSIAHNNFGTAGPIQVEFQQKWTSPNEHFNQIENWKCHMFNIRLTSLHRITYCILQVRYQNVCSIWITEKHAYFMVTHSEVCNLLLDRV